MKIAFVTEHFNPRYGGQEVYMRDFSSYLTSKGYEVHFFTQDSNVKDSSLVINIVKLPFYAKLGRWIQWLCFLKQVKKLLALDSYDIVMGTGISAGINVYQPHGGVSKASHRQNRLLTHPIHRFLKGISNFFSPKHILARQVEEQIFTNQDIHYIAISKMVKSHMQEFYKIPDKKITLIYNGVDGVRFRPADDVEKARARRELGLANDKIVLSLVAHNFKLKGLKEIIHVADKFKEQCNDFVILVAGKGKRKTYQKLIDQKALGAYFVFAGAVDCPELIYRASDVYLQPTWYDPCSLVVLEAMAAGLPVITSEYNGASEKIIYGESGWVIPSPDDISSFLRGLDFFRDAKVRAEVGHKARASVEDLTQLNNFEEMEKVFQDLK